MTLANFCNLQRRMAVARPDLAQILAWHAIQSIECFSVISSADQQLVKRIPVVSPIQAEANALPQLVFVDLAPPPFVKDVLVAGENGFHPQNDRPIADERPLFQQ